MFPRIVAIKNAGLSAGGARGKLEEVRAGG